VREVLPWSTWATMLMLKTFEGCAIRLWIRWFLPCFVIRGCIGSEFYDNFNVGF
jgi:hypothetical protein